MVTRRTFLASATASAALAALGITPEALAAERVKLGKQSDFSFDNLVAQARAMAAKPYVAPPAPPKAILEKIDYDAWGKIKFNTDDALFANGPGSFPSHFSISAGSSSSRCVCMW